MKFNIYGERNDSPYCETEETVVSVHDISLENLAQTIQEIFAHKNVQWIHVTKIEVEDDTTSPL